MLAIPFYTADGQQVVSLRFRITDTNDERPKYLQPPGSDVTIYNMPALRARHSTIVITEGELDCLTLRGLGYNAIGIPGANAWKPHYPLALDGFEKVIVWGDPDEAGQKFNEAVMASVRRAVPAQMDADINDVATRDSTGFLEIAQAYSRAGGGEK